MRILLAGLISLALAAPGAALAASGDDANLARQASIATATAATAARDQAALTQVVSAQQFPLAVYVIDGREHYGAAKGPLDVDTPMRIASNTKTFVSATVLRLWEQHKIDLDAPIKGLIAPEDDRLLRADGYDTGRITVRHLLSHSGGLYDLGSDPRFFAQFKANNNERLTRTDQIRMMTEYGDPLGAPGVKFHYSDGDYIILGEIVERLTGLNLAKAVRRELGLDRLGLTNAWWERFEPRPAGAHPGARHFLGDTDVTDIDPSMDLYGGGGLVMSPRDLATFFKALFEGRVFHSKKTLETMFWQGPHEGADGYRFGIFVKHTPAGDIWWHSGFWGTWAGYAPSTGIALAAFSDHQMGVKPALPALEGFFFPKR
ncbi:MAG: serine hydrolase domain-containing protein [Sphingomonas sp.]